MALNTLINQMYQEVSAEKGDYLPKYRATPITAGINENYVPRAAVRVVRFLYHLASFILFLCGESDRERKALLYTHAIVSMPLYNQNKMVKEWLQRAYWVWRLNHAMMLIAKKHPHRKRSKSDYVPYE